MLEALLHGKLSREIEGMEDVLTSSVFGTLKHIKAEECLLPFLQCAEPISSSPNPFLDINDIVEVRYEFWPWLDKSEYYGCEPDVLITMRSEYLSSLILIEAKYRSGKSSYADYDDKERVTDQLAREWLNLTIECKQEELKPILIYLTADITCPYKDIYDSLHELEAKCPEICEEYAPEFLWLSWRHLYKVCSNSDNGLIKDIGLFLDKLNLVFFNGLVKIKYYEINNWNFLEPIIQFNWDVMEAVKFDWRFNNE